MGTTSEVSHRRRKKPKSERKEDLQTLFRSILFDRKISHRKRRRENRSRSSSSRSSVESDKENKIKKKRERRSHRKRSRSSRIDINRTCQNDEIIEITDSDEPDAAKYPKSKNPSYSSRSSSTKEVNLLAPKIEPASKSPANLPEPTAGSSTTIKIASSFNLITNIKTDKTVESSAEARKNSETASKEISPSETERISEVAESSLPKPGESSNSKSADVACSNLIEAWKTTLQRGLSAEAKSELLGKYASRDPQGFQAPVLNQTLKSLLSGAQILRDEALIAQQNEFGALLSAIEIGVRSIVKREQKSSGLARLAETMNDAAHFIGYLHYSVSLERRNLVADELYAQGIKFEGLVTKYLFSREEEIAIEEKFFERLEFERMNKEVEKRLEAAKEEAARSAREEASRRAREEALERANEEARRKTEEEAMKRAVWELRSQANEAIERAKEEMRRKADEAIERSKDEEARKADEAIKRAKEGMRRKADEAIERAKEEEARKADEAIKRAKEEMRRKADEAIKRAKEEEARKADEAIKRAIEQAKKKADEAVKFSKEEARKEAVKVAQEIELRLKKEEAERKMKEEAERKMKEEAERILKEEAARLEDEAVQKEKEEAMKRADEASMQENEAALEEEKEVEETPCSQRFGASRHPRRTLVQAKLESATGVKSEKNVKAEKGQSAVFVRNSNFPGMEEMIRMARLKQGFPESALPVLMLTHAQSTLKSYKKPLEQWWDFSHRESIDTFDPMLSDIIEFLMENSSNGAPLSALTTARAALGFILTKDLGKDQNLALLFKGLTTKSKQ